MIVLLFIVIIRLIVIQLSSCLSIYMYLPLFIPFDMRNMFFSINKNICANIFYLFFITTTLLQCLTKRIYYTMGDFNNKKNIALAYSRHLIIM